MVIKWMSFHLNMSYLSLTLHFQFIILYMTLLITQSNIRFNTFLMRETHQQLLRNSTFHTSL